MDRDDPDLLEFFAAEFWPLRRVGFLLTGDWDQAEELAQDLGLRVRPYGTSVVASGSSS